MNPTKGAKQGFIGHLAHWMGLREIIYLTHIRFCATVTYMKAPATLQEAIVYFSDTHRAFDYAVNLRWPDGQVRCPRCNSDRHSFIKTRRIWYCNPCKKQFTVKVGSIFEDSALGLDKWMTAVWMLVNSRNGVSSHELARSLGITQKSAWFVLQRVRKALHTNFYATKLGGGPNEPEREVEIDETFVGGKIRNMHKDRRLRYQQEGAHHGKTIVMGMLDRSVRQVRTAVIPNVKRETLQAQVLKTVKKGSTVYTDEAVGYDKLKNRFVHEMVNHTEEYVRGRVHTNGLENFWALLKRGLTGTYVAVEPFHLFRYVDEQAFRYNNRKDDAGNKLTDAARFNKAMSQVGGGRHLSYAELTGKDESPRYETTRAGETQIPF
jgi:transposase-like protein